MSDRTVFLIRGLPGSGKSTLSKLLSENGRYPVYSIDDYFTDKLSGLYQFDHKLNHLAYTACEENTKKSMEEGCEKIFVDNTFTLEWEMEPYYRMAGESNYRIFVLTVENRHGGQNQHGISMEQIQRMAIKYKVKLSP